MERMIIVSGYFDPIHVGHLELFENAKKISNNGKVLAIINNDKQAVLKKTKSFMMEYDRLKICSSIKTVDHAVLSIDKDRTICETLRQVAQTYGESYKLFFANGGDQNNDSIPEGKVCNELDIELIDGLGEKIESSSNLIKNSLKVNYR